MNPRSLWYCWACEVIVFVLMLFLKRMWPVKCWPRARQSRRRRLVIRPLVPAIACVIVCQTFVAFADDLPPAVERKIDFVQEVQPI